MADEVCKSGKWVTLDGKIVDSEPAEGRLLVAPGTTITPDVQAAIDRAEVAEKGDDVETAAAPAAVETSAVTSTKAGAHKRPAS